MTFGVSEQYYSLPYQYFISQFGICMLDTEVQAMVIIAVEVKLNTMVDAVDNVHLQWSCFPKR